MKNKKIIALIIFLIIIILVAIVVAFSILNSSQEENLNEVNMQNINNANEINTLENNNSVNENSQNNENQNNKNQNNENQNNENQTNTKLNENDTDDTQTSETNNNKINENGGTQNMNNQSEEIKINLIINNKTFTATLNNNETARQLVSMFPMTLNMSDLHSNEKYNYLDTTLTTNSNRPGRINAGDIKLYGNNCLVVFYESFSNSYNYTDLGKVDNVNAFVSELGSGSVNIRFELAN